MLTLVFTDGEQLSSMVLDGLFLTDVFKITENQPQMFSLI